ncbi:MAG: DUF5118 domain-containing protein, partial [Flavobacteriales bacterium]
MKMNANNRFVRLSLVTLTLLMFSSSATFAQRKKSKKNTPQAQNVKKTGPKPYSKVITKDAVSDIGLFSVHRVD